MMPDKAIGSMGVVLLNQPDEYIPRDYDYRPHESKMNLFQGKDPYKPSNKPLIKKNQDDVMEEAIEDYLDDNPEVIEEYLNR